jgi:hypothetical protein
MLFKKGLLQRGNHQDFRTALCAENGPFIGREVPIAWREPIQGITQRTRFLLIACISGKIDIEPRHFIESDDSIGRSSRQIATHPLGKLFVAPPIAQRPCGHTHNLEPWRNLAFPLERVNANRMTAYLASECNTHKIPLQSTERKVFVEAKGKLHQ